MELLGVVGALASIISLFISIFVAAKVIKITNNIEIRGEGNLGAGRDINYRG
jgi:hypothetical protein